MFVIFRYINIVFILFLFFGCARKQKNIFDFSRNQKIKINKVNLPIAKNFTVVKNNEKLFLSWKDVEKDFNPNDYKQDIHFLGYNIYRFASSGFIPKHSLNKKIVRTNSFFDENILKIKENYCYLIRTVFEIQNKIILGPVSKIICIK